MASFNKFHCTVENLAEGVHDFSADALTLALSTTANVPVNTNTILANITEIAYTNLSARVVTVSASSQTTGTYKLVCTDLVLTASGAVATFEHVTLYNDTPTSPVDPLISWWSYGSAVTLANGETFTNDYDATNGVIQIA
jgi:hypothetical protein